LKPNTDLSELGCLKSTLYRPVISMTDLSVLGLADSEMGMPCSSPHHNDSVFHNSFNVLTDKFDRSFIPNGELRSITTED
jgi:hypothetical protein